VVEVGRREVGSLTSRPSGLATKTQPNSTKILKAFRPHLGSALASRSRGVEWRPGRSAGAATDPKPKPMPWRSPHGCPSQSEQAPSAGAWSDCCRLPTCVVVPCVFLPSSRPICSSTRSSSRAYHVSSHVLRRELE